MNDKSLAYIKSYMEKEGLDAVLLTDGYNMQHISGYSGHTGCILLTRNKRIILTDSRYTEQATLEAPEYTCVDIGTDGYSKKVADLLGTSIHVGFENKHISYQEYKAYSDKGLILKELGDEINNLRMVKTAAELKKLKRAEAIGDEAFTHILEFLKTKVKDGISEKQVALEIEYFMRSRGASGTSFDTIAASGKNSSMPHAVPTDKLLCDGDFLTMDFGCIYEGYCSDMTRTIYIGDKPEEKQLEVYNVVIMAQKEALKHIRPGAVCSEVDKVARDIIRDAGYGDFFGHGLGHGVGLYIHEEPRLSTKCDVVLQAGMVVTVEPGIYLPGEFGVRIEDMVVVTSDGYDNLTNSSKELIRIEINEKTVEK